MGMIFGGRQRRLGCTFAQKQCALHDRPMLPKDHRRDWASMFTISVAEDGLAASASMLKPAHVAQVTSHGSRCDCVPAANPLRPHRFHRRSMQGGCGTGARNNFRADHHG